ncbi:prevent-host-death protein [Dyadobacter sp. CY261]|uniref:type II toxin-antitoxin system Phd/YefM family antitoxin n=1 Tax=Dyadobacter sp. CY261 TaxID=2907203 RepID=UPI001F3C2665|nr:prevent-host-death protein [Dyadobacter sp. CY261]MCF0073869.1 prevent-host-death protein [Dyadobacter sp. CY261]
MLTISADQIEANAPAVLLELAKGERVGVTFGEGKTVQAYLVPGDLVPRSNGPRKLGILEGKVTVTFADDFKMTEEEFLGL